MKSGRFSPILIFPAIFFMFMVSFVSYAHAHVYMEAKLVVNILPGNNQTDEELQDIVEGVNKIFSQCGNISFTLNPDDINRLLEPPKGFELDENNETRACGPDDEDYRNAANPEIEYGGYKVFIPHSILDSDEESVNGETYVNKPISMISRNRSIDGDSHTWAHEIGHGLGLDHNDSEDNLMHPFRRRRDNSPAGSNLTKEQCNTTVENFKKLNPVEGKTADQQSIDSGDRTVKTILISTNPIDSNGKIVNGFEYLDIHAARMIFYRSPILKELELEIFLSGLSPRNIPVETKYLVYLDVDNNQDTGIRFKDFKGIDKIISLEFKGKFPFRAPQGTSVVRIIDNGNGIHPEPGVEELRPPKIIEYFKFINYPNVTDLTKVAPKGKPDESIVVKIPLASLGKIADNINVGFESSGGGITASSQQFSIPTNIIKPSIKAERLVVNIGEAVSLSGYNFAPNSEVRFYWNNKFKVSIASTITNNEGIFLTSIKLPKSLVGDHVLDAIDSKGNVAIMVFTVMEKDKFRNIKAAIFFIVFFIVVLVLFMYRKRKISKK